MNETETASTNQNEQNMPVPAQVSTPEATAMPSTVQSQTSIAPDQPGQKKSLKDSLSGFLDRSGLKLDLTAKTDGWQTVALVAAVTVPPSAAYVVCKLSEARCQ